MEKLSKSMEMSDIALAQANVRLVAAPPQIGDVVATQIARAYRRINSYLRSKQRVEWSHRRVKAFWYGEARRVDNHEIATLKEIIELTEARQAYAESQARYARLEAYLSSTDADFYSDAIDWNRQQAGVLDRPGSRTD